MSQNALLVPVLVDACAPAESMPLGARVGRICTIDDDGVPSIDFPGNPSGPMAARLALPPEEAIRLAQDWQRVEVLIVFASQDLRQPIITGLVSSSLEQACAPALGTPARVELIAGEELVIQCGDARIVLRQDGKLIIGAREIDTRARQKHRIRGGTVSIN